MEIKLTDWYEATQKPVRKGVYQVQDLFDENDGFMAYWNGKFWLFYNKNGTALQFQTRKWRGLSLNSDASS